MARVIIFLEDDVWTGNGDTLNIDRSALEQAIKNTCPNVKYVEFSPPELEDGEEIIPIHELPEDIKKEFEKKVAEGDAYDNRIYAFTLIKKMNGDIMAYENGDYDNYMRYDAKLKAWHIPQY
jgi:hypothetical protein